MAKYIILSFDDGRNDTYINAVPIMLKHNIRATINITTDFLEYPDTCGLFPDVVKRAMSVENMLELQDKGFEIANHGAHHKNDVEDIRKANKKLKEWGIDIKDIGFASPYSQITQKNINPIMKLIKNKELSYIRSGTQVRRENFIYKLIYILKEATKSSYLFYLLNKQNIFKISSKNILLKGITVNKNTTFEQIKSFIKKMPDNTYIILNFHSILASTEAGYQDKWSWDIRKFEKLCNFLEKENYIKVIKTIDLFEG